MIALDTNVFVRLLVADDVAQLDSARRLVEASLEAGEDCLVSVTVLCELEWVLDSVYRASRADIRASFDRLLMQRPFLIEDRAQVERAVERYGRGKADFSDYLMGTRAEAHGARTTYTFDRALRTAQGFTLLAPRR